MPDVDAPPETLLVRYAAAVQARDVDALIALYADEVRVFDAWGVWVHEGVAAWRQMIELWLGSSPGERFTVSADDLRVQATPRLALLTAVLTYGSVSADGAPLREMQNRLTWVLQPDRGAWKIVHEHTSLPVGFEDAKALLKRDAASA